MQEANCEGFPLNACEGKKEDMHLAVTYRYLGAVGWVTALNINHTAAVYVHSCREVRHSALSEHRPCGGLGGGGVGAWVLAMGSHGGGHVCECPS